MSWRWQERHRLVGVRLMGAMELRSVWLGKRCKKRQGAMTLVLDLAKALLLRGVRLRTSIFPDAFCGLCGYFEHQRPEQFEGSVAEPLQTITAIFLVSKWGFLLLRIVLQGALSEVMKV